MSDSETWQAVLDTDITGRHFTMEESGARTEGTMQAIEVEEDTGYIRFIDSNGDEVIGCAPDWGQAFFLSNGSIRVSVVYVGALTIDPA